MRKVEKLGATIVKPTPKVSWGDTVVILLTWMATFGKPRSTPFGRWMRTVT